MADVQYSHDDFEVVRTDPRFGGFEVLKHKDERTHTQFLRKSVIPGDSAALEQVSQLKSHVFQDGLSGAAHPIYTHGGRKWILLSLPEEHYRNSALAV